MFPHQFRRLVELLRTQLGSIQEAVHENASATREAQESENIKWSEIPRVIASSIEVLQNSAAAYAERQQANRQQELLISTQERTARWTRNAAIAAMFYGAIAAGQGVLMWRTYTEIQSQTKAAECTAKAAQDQATLMRQQLVGTEGAYVILDDPGVDTTDPAMRRITIGVQNTGIATGTVDFSAIIQKMSIRDEKPIGEQLPLNFSGKKLSKQNPDYSPHVELPWPLPTVSDLNLWPGSEMVRIEGQYTYDDGFGDKTTQKFCYLWLPQMQFDGPTAGGPGRTVYHAGGWSNGDAYCPLKAMKRYFSEHRDQASQKN